MLAENGIEGSMSEPGCPYNNSCEELFFALLKSVFSLCSKAFFRVAQNRFFATLKKEKTQLQDMSCNFGENMLQEMM